MIPQIVRHLRQQTLAVHLQTLQQDRAAHFLFRVCVIARPQRQCEFERSGVPLREVDDFLEAVQGGLPDLVPIRVRGREVEEVRIAGDAAAAAVAAAADGIVTAFRARVGNLAFIVRVIVMDPKGPRRRPIVVWREVVIRFRRIRGGILEHGRLFRPGGPEIDLGGGEVDVDDEVVAGAGGPGDELSGAGAGEVGYGGVVVDGVDVGDLREREGEGTEREKGEEKRREGGHGVEKVWVEG